MLQPALPRVLFVDDDENLLAGLRRATARMCESASAQGGINGLKALRDEGPFSLVVVDMRMPGMDGLRFLAHARKLAPETVYVMLTGNNDQRTAADAVNEGRVFRFLNKPVPREKLEEVITQAGEHHRAKLAERDVLERTLTGALATLIDVLRMARPAVFGNDQRRGKVAATIARAAGAKTVWELEIAAMLSHVGSVSIPEEELPMSASMQEWTGAQKEAQIQQARLGAQMLARIPRMGFVARIIEHQFDGLWAGPANKHGTRDPALDETVRVLQAATILERARVAGCTMGEAMAALEMTRVGKDAALIEAIRSIPQGELGFCERNLHERIPVSRVKTGMTLREAVRTTRGELLLAAGNQVTEALCERLEQYVRRGLVVGEVSVERLNEGVSKAA
jgi:CheY-like chemotaxis protein